MSSSTSSRQQQPEPRDRPLLSSSSPPSSEAQRANDVYSWNFNGRQLRAPRLIRVLFDTFPLYSFPPEELPVISPRPADKHLLYIYCHPKDAAEGNPSFNPTCLKWQTFFKICGIEFNTISSNNHASPSGALPFLLPASKDTDGRKSQALIPSHKLAWWTEEVQHKARTTVDLHAPDVQAFFTLLDTKVRLAWLHNLYIEPRNFSSITLPNYTHSVSIFPVPYFLGRQMQSAAIDEVKRSCNGDSIDILQLYAEADAAFEALSTILNKDQWFFSGKEAGLFDAAVFAYTHLLLSLPINTEEADLLRSVQKHGNLIAHRDRMLQKWFN